MRLKDRRKQWQKDSVTFSWSLCGTMATERVGKTFGKAIDKAKQRGLFDDMTFIKSKHHKLNVDNRIPPKETDEQYLDRIRQLLAA